MLWIYHSPNHWLAEPEITAGDSSLSITNHNLRSLGANKAKQATIAIPLIPTILAAEGDPHKLAIPPEAILPIVNPKIAIDLSPITRPRNSV